MEFVLIGLGGAAGAAARYAIDAWVARATGGSFPWGTMAVNVSGALLLGFAFAVTIERGLLPASVRGPVMVGFIGAYTTFSTLMLESWELLETGAIGLAALDLVGSIILGMAALGVGLAVGRLIG